MDLRVFDIWVQNRNTATHSKAEGMNAMQNYDLGRVFSRIFEMVAKCFLPAAGFIAVCLVAMFAVLFLAFGSLFMAIISSAGSGPIAQGQAMQEAMQSFLAGGSGVIMLVIGVIGSVLISGVLIAGCVDACLRSSRGETPTFASCFSAGLSNCLKVAGFFLLWYILLLIIVGVIGGGLAWLVSGWLGGLVGVILFVVYTALFSTSIPAMVNEPETGVLSAFSRGPSLASGHLGLVVLTLFLWTLIYIAISFVVSLVLSLVGGILGAISPYLMILMIVPYLAFYVAIYLFMYGSMASIYAELRLIKEGGDTNNIADVFS